MNRWLALIPLAVLAALAALFIGWSLKRDPAFKPDALVARQQGQDGLWDGLADQGVGLEGRVALQRPADE